MGASLRVMRGWADPTVAGRAVPVLAEAGIAMAVSAAAAHTPAAAY